MLGPQRKVAQGLGRNGASALSLRLGKGQNEQSFLSVTHSRHAPPPPCPGSLHLAGAGPGWVGRLTSQGAVCGGGELRREGGGGDPTLPAFRASLQSRGRLRGRGWGAEER